jgi:hypothetical protein
MVRLFSDRPRYNPGRRFLGVGVLPHPNRARPRPRSRPRFHLWQATSSIAQRRHAHTPTRPYADTPIRRHVSPAMPFAPGAACLPLEALDPGKQARAVALSLEFLLVAVLLQSARAIAAFSSSAI